MGSGIVGLALATSRRSKVLDSKTTLYKKIEKLETENKNFKSINKILQYQLDRATNDLIRKDLTIKEMENGRAKKSK